MKCQSCGGEFKKTIWNQVYCGSKTKKIGCSYKKHIERIGHYNKTKNKEYMQNYIKDWMKKQRKENTEYAQRQRKSKRAYYKTPRGKELIKLSSQRNIKTKMECNRRRKLKLKQVEGTHTLTHWKFIKKMYDFHCVKCGISEEELKKKWKGTNFSFLLLLHSIFVLIFL